MGQTKLLMNYACKIPDVSEIINGSNEIIKDPSGPLTGQWKAGEGKESLFHLKHYPCGLLVGYQNHPDWCSLQGRATKEQVEFVQIWGKASPYQNETCLTQGFVSPGGDEMEVSFACILQNSLKTGTNRLLRVLEKPEL